MSRTSGEFELLGIITYIISYFGTMRVSLALIGMIGWVSLSSAFALLPYAVGRRPYIGIIRTCARWIIEVVIAAWAIYGLGFDRGVFNGCFRVEERAVSEWEAVICSVEKLPAERSEGGGDSLMW